VRKIHYSEKHPYRSFARIKEMLTARRKFVLLSLLGHEKSPQTILITLEGKAVLEYSSVARMQGETKLLILDLCAGACYLTNLFKSLSTF
jgi:hypothetical protein